ncbi:MAG: MarR family transcriptional regulator [Actinomycetota bacterium]|nr:MarR family transcriptional regulator [Actinomycetota bacterium]
MPDMDQWPSSRLLSTAARLVEHAWNERLASIGMTHAGIIALDVLAAHGPMTQAQLASIVRVQAQTMGKTLSRLESHGHVHRVRSTQDRRSHLVSLSDEGRGLLDSAHQMETGLLETAGMDQHELRSDLKTIIRSVSSTAQNLREAESRARAALADSPAGN